MRLVGFAQKVLFSDLCLPQRRKGAKRYRVLKDFFAPWRLCGRRSPPQMYFRAQLVSCYVSTTGSVRLETLSLSNERNNLSSES
jgi:hypothetical protein